MRKIFYVFLIFILCNNVFASDFTHYPTPYPASRFMQTNIDDLRKSYYEYSENMPKELENIQRSPLLNKSFSADESSLQKSPVQWGLQQSEKQEIEQRNRKLPSNYTLKLQTENPGW